MSGKHSNLLLICVFKLVKNEAPAATDHESLRVAEVEDLSRFSWFTRNSARQAMRFTARTVASSSSIGTRTRLVTEVNDEKFECFALTTADLMSYVVIAEGNYPSSAAYQLIWKELLPRFSAASLDHLKLDCQDEPPAFLKQALTTYQNATPDTLDLTKQTIEDIKEIMVDNIEKLLARGVKIDELIKKSNDLEAASKIYLTETKKLNKCRCVLL
jgi:synaptobrevin homolog YKT6